MQKGAKNLNKIKMAMGQEYAARLSTSPFFLVVDYRGMTVAQFSELRSRLREAGSEMHVVKTTIFRTVAEASGLKNVGEGLVGQLAVVTGLKDVAASAKAVKTFNKDTNKGALCFGFMDGERVEANILNQLADLPPLNELRAKLLATINAPATNLVRTIGAPGEQVARVIKAHADKMA